MNYESDPEVEYSNLLNGVQIWDVGCERQGQITGPDTMKLAQLLTPRNLSVCAVGYQVENADMQFRRTRKSGSVFRRNDIATLLGKLFERRQVRMRHERHGFSFPAEPLYDPDQLIENGIRAFREQGMSGSFHHDRFGIG